MRNTFLDCTRGLGICLVVFGHVERGLSDAHLLPANYPFAQIDFTLYTFHMPLFFLLAVLGVFLLLCKALESWRAALQVLANVPLAAIGSLVPLVPFAFVPLFGMSVTLATILSVPLCGAVLFGVGAYKALTLVGDWRVSGLQMLVIGMVSAAAGYGVPTDFSIDAICHTRAGESGSWFGMAPNDAKAFATALASCARN